MVSVGDDRFGAVVGDRVGAEAVDWTGAVAAAAVVVDGGAGGAVVGDYVVSAPVGTTPLPKLAAEAAVVGTAPSVLSWFWSSRAICGGEATAAGYGTACSRCSAQFGAHAPGGVAPRPGRRGRQLRCGARPAESCCRRSCRSVISMTNLSERSGALAAPVRGRVVVMFLNEAVRLSSHVNSRVAPVGNFSPRSSAVCRAIVKLGRVRPCRAIHLFTTL